MEDAAVSQRGQGCKKQRLLGLGVGTAKCIGCHSVWWGSDQLLTGLLYGTIFEKIVFLEEVTAVRSSILAAERHNSGKPSPRQVSDSPENEM